MKHMPETYLLLDNIRSVHNVGSIFRTADTIGITKIFCVGTTPTPTDRFGRKRADFAKVSLGAEDSLKWEHVEDATTFLRKFRKEKGVSKTKSSMKIIALEQSPNSIDYKEVSVAKSDKNIVIILGNEVEGVNKELLEMCDVIAEIPMQGKKESLNVSVSAGIFLFRLLDAPLI